MTENLDYFNSFRQGHLCGRCLRNVDSRGHDELSMMLDQEEEEDASVANSAVSETHRSMVMLQIQVYSDRVHALLHRKAAYGEMGVVFCAVVL
jgi:hypothetical protein